MDDDSLRCVCGSYDFRDRTSANHPTARLTDRLLGRVDIELTGICNNCDSHVSTRLHNVRRTD